MSARVTPRVPGASLAHDRGGSGASEGPRVGVLAVQGDVLEHLHLIAAAGGVGVPLVDPGELPTVDALVLPGGESTTIALMLERYGLLEPLREVIGAGLPTLGTCAGAILLGSQTMLADGRPTQQRLLGVLDVTTRRNAFGRQIASFEGPVDVTGVAGGAFHAVFIRAPWFERVGPDVDVLASVTTPVGERVVVVERDHVTAVAFHPELSGDARLHRRLVEAAAARRHPEGAR